MEYESACQSMASHKVDHDDGWVQIFSLISVDEEKDQPNFSHVTVQAEQDA